MLSHSSIIGCTSRRDSIDPYEFSLLGHKRKRIVSSSYFRHLRHWMLECWVGYPVVESVPHARCTSQHPTSSKMWSNDTRQFESAHSTPTMDRLCRIMLNIWSASWCVTIHAAFDASVYESGEYDRWCFILSSVTLLTATTSVVSQLPH